MEQKPKVETTEQETRVKIEDLSVLEDISTEEQKGIVGGFPGSDLPDGLPLLPKP